MPISSFARSCDYSWQYDSKERRCGGRAADVRHRGKLGGDGRYKDSYERDRLYGPNNDIYDKVKSSDSRRPLNTNNSWNYSL